MLIVYLLHTEIVSREENQFSHETGTFLENTMEFDMGQDDGMDG